MPIYETSLGAASTFDSEDINSPPPLPPKEEKLQAKARYTMNSPIAEILMYRESGSNLPSTISSAAEVYMNEKVDIESKLAQIEANGETFWHEFILNFGNAFFEKHNPQDLEKKMLHGIPDDLRCIAYLSILKIKATVENHTYESLVKKAKLAEFEGGNSVENIVTEYGELVQVYWYCLKGTVYENAQTTGALSPELIENLARILHLIKGASKPEILTILFKLTEMFDHILQNEFCYKGSRCLEDLAGEQFIHISKQGIDIIGYFNKVLEQITEYLSDEIVLTVLDLILIEGPDFLLRLIVGLFVEQKKRLMNIEGDELNEYLYSEALFSTIDEKTLQGSMETEISIIKYENEFSLMNSNAVSGNDNEISNLQESNQELTQKLEQLKESYAQLQKTHEEIFVQNSEYAKKLSEAHEEKESLAKRKESLQQKYNQLTMQENLGNTIKANRDISAENQDLESQIEAMKKNVEAKTKLIK